MSRNDKRRSRNRNRGNRNNSQNENSFKKTYEQKNNRLRICDSQEFKKFEAEKENAIKEFKAAVTICEICGEPISDISTAIANSTTKAPVHFDCVIKKITEKENLGPNEKVTYIGNGTFAVLYFENIHDMRHFTIKKRIEWENREQERGEWRETMAGLYSGIK